MPTCLQAAAAVHSSPSNSAGMEFWVVLQPAGAPPLARAEFDSTAAPGSMCADGSIPGCNPTCQTLRPNTPEAATLCIRDATLVIQTLSAE